MATKPTNFPNGLSTSVLKATTVQNGNGVSVTPVVNSLALSPAQVAANTSAEQIFAVAGVASTDIVLSVNKPTAQAGLGIVGWRVSSAGHVAITFGNFTGAPITPTAAETYKIVTMPTV